MSRLCPMDASHLATNLAARCWIPDIESDRMTLLLA